MKRAGILNADLSGRIARLGHTDAVVVADCGLPVPPTVPVVDLAVVRGLPRFTDVLDAIGAEVVVEHATIAAEAAATTAGAWLRERYPGAEEIPHERLKELVTRASFVVRTGEDTPFANVVLRCGVPF